MTTVQGVIKDGAGNPVGTEIRWQPLTGPTLQPDGDIVSKSIVVCESDSETGEFSVGLEQGDWRATWAIGSQVSKVLLRVSDAGTFSLEELNLAYNDRLKTQVLAWAMAEQFTLASPNNILTSSTVTWADGTAGTYTCTVPNEEWGVADAFEVTYARGSISLTVTQPEVTRDDEGVVTLRPNMTIA